MDKITKAESARGRKLKIGAIAAPVALTLTPAAITLLLLLLTPFGPAASVVLLFIGVVATVLGLIAGVTIAAILTHKRQTWTRQMRERIAARGIKAEEINLFRSEIRPNERRALKAVEASDLLLADAYRETLASRLTATRILKSSRRELSLAKKRQDSLRQLKSSRAAEFQTEIIRDIEKINDIHNEAKLMLNESDSRLQMIEAAASRHGHLADSELALKKLSARTAELPLALEAAKMSEQIRFELENEDFDSAK